MKENRDRSGKTTEHLAAFHTLRFTLVYGSSIIIKAVYIQPSYIEKKIII